MGGVPHCLLLLPFCFLESQAQTLLPTFSVKVAHFHRHKNALNKRSLLDGAGIFIQLRLGICLVNAPIDSRVLLGRDGMGPPNSLCLECVLSWALPVRENVFSWVFIYKVCSDIVSGYLRVPASAYSWMLQNGERHPQSLWGISSERCMQLSSAMFNLLAHLIFFFWNRNLRLICFRIFFVLGLKG